MTEQEIITHLQNARNWEDKYRFIIELGRNLPAIDESTKSQTIEVKGCESQVWLSWQEIEGKYHFQAHSDARIVKGLIAIILVLVEDKQKNEIANLDFDSFFAKIQLLDHLSTTRSNGVHAIVQAIKAMSE